MQHLIDLTTLIKATLIAVLIAAIALVTLILPAEYNIDPTGVGQKLGLTLLADAAETTTSPPQPEIVSADPEQVVEVTVPAGEGIEYKFRMNQHDKLFYEWITDGEPLYFDLHGEPEGDTTGYFESYAIATLDSMEGSFTAPFTGSHGWYWKNTSTKPVAIQLIVNGQYQIIGL
ncbi:hypothetical protein [Congregibacter litoralis]|uniref:Transmembrane anchor protein n=1 Tax=Congregibacter litoralis KT71 TaxID=314285 RepID=A4ADW4_9GAMM|nr:hypothetical protein [Congregibacter litoralis]EAQ95774.2 hypothetical protein KT71_13534 [Congregibacter litoralis KT71]